MVFQPTSEQAKYGASGILKRIEKILQILQDFSGLTSTSDLDKYADFIISGISTAVDRAIPKSKSVRSESNPISDETLVLIKEKRRLRRQYSQNKDPAVKTRINQLQKQVKEKLRIETQAS